VKGRCASLRLAWPAAHPVGLRPTRDSLWACGPRAGFARVAFGHTQGGRSYYTKRESAGLTPKVEEVDITTRGSAGATPRRRIESIDAKMNGRDLEF
jgi:hypothetical protein